MKKLLCIPLVILLVIIAIITSDMYPATIKKTGEWKFEITNNSLSPLVVPGYKTETVISPSKKYEKEGKGPVSVFSMKSYPGGPKIIQPGKRLEFDVLPKGAGLTGSPMYLTQVTVEGHPGLFQGIWIKVSP